MFGPYSMPTQDDTQPDAGAWVRSVFKTPDTLSAFVRALDAHQAAALDAMLYGRGVKYDPDAIRRWERTL